MGRHVEREGRIGAYKGFWCGHLKEEILLEELGVDGKIIL